MGSGASVAGRGMTCVSAGNESQKPFYCPSLVCGANQRKRRGTADLSNDFMLQYEKKDLVASRGSWKRKFSIGQAADNFKIMEKLVNGKSIEQDSPLYDPLLVFVMDTTVLAAITVQRLARGYCCRKEFRSRRDKKGHIHYLSSVIASPGATDLLRVSAFSRSPSTSANNDGMDYMNNSSIFSTMRKTNQEDEKWCTEPNSDDHTFELILSHKQKAIEARRAGDTQLALEHMEKFKSLKKSLGDKAVDILTPRMQRCGGPADVTPEGLETCKRKAMAARKSGNTELALEYMAEYTRMKASLELQQSPTDILSRSSSTSPATQDHVSSGSSSTGGNTALEEQIEAAKSAAILAKREGRQDEAIAQMKRYKSLLSRIEADESVHQHGVAVRA